MKPYLIFALALVCLVPAFIGTGLVAYRAGKLAAVSSVATDMQSMSDSLETDEQVSISEGVVIGVHTVNSERVDCAMMTDKEIAESILHAYGITNIEVTVPESDVVLGKDSI
jgi:hypothetical protein